MLSVLLAGGSLAVSFVVLVVVWRVLHNSRMSREAGEERLEMLREQQERLKLMYQERDILKEELERLRRVLEEEKRMLALPAPTEPKQRERPEKRLSRWRRFFGF